MSEANLWKYVRDGMGSRWEVQRHEDAHSSGIPDLSFSMDRHGWVELKYVSDPPKRPTTKLKIKHWTVSQKNWLERHGKRAGNCWVLLQVDDYYLLLHWPEACAYLNKTTYSELCTKAVHVWQGSIEWKDFAWALSNLDHYR